MITLILFALLAQSDLSWQETTRTFNGHPAHVASDPEGLHLRVTRPAPKVPVKGWYAWVDRAGLYGVVDRGYWCMDEDPQHVYLYTAREWASLRFARVEDFKAYLAADPGRSALPGANHGVDVEWFRSSRAHDTGDRDHGPPPDGRPLRLDAYAQRWILGGVLACLVIALLAMYARRRRNAWRLV